MKIRLHKNEKSRIERYHTYSSDANYIIKTSKISLKQTFYPFQLSTLPFHSKTRRGVIGHGLVHSDNCVFCYILTVGTMLSIRLYPLDMQKRGNIHFFLPFIKKKKLCDLFQNSAFFYHINS